MEQPDRRPPVWIGHVSLHTPDIPKTREFMIQLGMRDLAGGEGFAVLELRGGTHMVLLPADGPEIGPSEFDLMVDDLEATRGQLVERGLEPSKIEPGNIHSWFTIESPSGHTIKFNSTHVSDQPV